MNQVLHDADLRRKALFGLALLFSLMTVLMLVRHDKAVARRYGADAEQIEILIAQTALAAGERVEAVELGRRSVPVEYAHTLAVAGTDSEQVVGLTLGQPLVAGQSLLWSDLATEGAVGLLSTSVREGLRAVSLPVRPADALGGLLRPGDAVDILATFQKPQGGQVTVTLLQDVLVLATGSALHPGERDPDFRSISVQVTPKESEVLFFARRRGELGLTLRNPTDRDPVADLPEISFKDLLHIDEAPTVRREPRTPILRAPRSRSSR